jgi:hypothetical protein
MIIAGLNEELRRIAWAEFAMATSVTSNSICNTANDEPPDKMFYGKNTDLHKHLVELGRVGYVSKDRTIKSKKFVTNSANKVIMCGYAHNHSRDTYRLLKVSTKSIIQTRNVKWAEWKPTQPGDDIQIESFRAEEDEAESGEDDYKINHKKYFGSGEDSNKDSMPDLIPRTDEHESSDEESFG